MIQDLIHVNWTWIDFWPLPDISWYYNFFHRWASKRMVWMLLLRGVHTSCEAFAFNCESPALFPSAVKYMSRKLCSIKVDQWYDEHGHATLSFHTFPVNSSAIFCPIFSSILRHKFTLEQKIAIYTYHPYHCIVHNTWTIFLEARKLFYEFNSCWLTLKMYLDC